MFFTNGQVKNLKEKRSQYQKKLFHIYNISGGEAKIVQQIYFELFANIKELQNIEIEDVCLTLKNIYKNNSELKLWILVDKNALC